MARSVVHLQSVSPKMGCEILVVGDDAVDDDDELEVDDSGIEGERLVIKKDDEVVKKVKDPKLPTSEEVEDHYVMGHIPYRDWCPICIKAQGRDMGHMKDNGKERLLPEYSWDYCFPGDELGFKWSVLVGKEKGSRSLMATAVPNKGGGSKFVVDKCMEFIGENGDSGNKIIVKTDQENLKGGLLLKSRQFKAVAVMESLKREFKMSRAKSGRCF